jgi:hypothetical protein
MLLAFVATTYAHAQLVQFYTGNSLMEKCESDNTWMLCLGYISGIADAMETVEHIENLPVEWSFCVPKEVTNFQLRKVVMKHMEENPADQHYGASGIVREALHNAFPCR